MSSMVHHKRSTCRICDSNQLARVLSLGPTPLANSFLKPEDRLEDEPSYPLDVYYCQTCSLLQLLDIIDPEVLFRNYIYLTGTSETIAAHNEDYAKSVTEHMQLGAQDLVVEVASNDGSLLRCFRQQGVRILGVEPASNIAEMANAEGIPTVNQFFNSTIAHQLREDYGPARVVIGNNVLAHVDQTRDFLTGCKHLLTDDGLVIIEVPYLQDLLDNLEYDTIYHEHLCYFSVSTLMRLCDAVGLSITRVDHVPVHGGSLRMFAGRAETRDDHAPAVYEQVQRETEAGLNELARYQAFALQVEQNREQLLDLLTSLKQQGASVVGYGAPAKGNTLLNYCGIGTDLLAYTVDRNPLKVGLLTPGMHIPVLPVTQLLADQPDYVLILAWNFAPEIMRQQHTYFERGGRFIIPIPKPKVVAA